VTDGAFGFVHAHRRLTESQYRNTIATVFGEVIRIDARFEPERREDGLLAIGNGRLSISTAGLEQYHSLAQSIGDQVMSVEAPVGPVGPAGCGPAEVSGADRLCAERFIRQWGGQLFRRPLTRSEVDNRMSIWKGVVDQSGDARKGFKAVLVSLLIAPDFLFRVERAEPDPFESGAYRLDAYSKATRLAYTLWDSPPDETLLEAARTGAIHSPERLQSEVRRMLASPKLEGAVRALFSDMLQFDRFNALNKDSTAYPKFSQAVADSSREETLRFLVDHLVRRELDYRDIFTSQETFLNRSLAAVYNVPYASAESWEPFRFPDESGRSGILTHISLLSLFSHPASSAPTVRGVRLNEIFLCVHLPDPPADVDFSRVQATENGTVRARLIDHMTNPGCSSCHMISDPVGLALEHFDGIGQARRFENGLLIDVSLVAYGVSMGSGAQAVGEYLRGSSATPACLVRNVYFTGRGGPLDARDSLTLAAKTKAFADGGFRLPGLYQTLLSDPQFYRVPAPHAGDAAPSSASAPALKGDAG
jgi:hypothetical protein